MTPHQARRRAARARRTFRAIVLRLLGSHARNANCDRGPLQRSIWSLAVDSRESMRLREPIDEASRGKLLGDLLKAVERHEHRKFAFEAALHGIVIR